MSIEIDSRTKFIYKNINEYNNSMQPIAGVSFKIIGNNVNGYVINRLSIEAKIKLKYVNKSGKYSIKT